MQTTRWSTGVRLRYKPTIQVHMPIVQALCSARHQAPCCAALCRSCILWLQPHQYTHISCSASVSRCISFCSAGFCSSVRTCSHSTDAHFALGLLLSQPTPPSPRPTARRPTHAQRFQGHVSGICTRGCRRPTCVMVPDARLASSSTMDDAAVTPTRFTHQASKACAATASSPIPQPPADMTA